jgi:integrase
MVMDKHPATTRDNPVLHRSDAEATYKASRQVTPEMALEHFSALGPEIDPELIDAKASETWRALRYRWPRYERWCAETGRTGLPCGAEQLREYVRALRAEHLAPSSIAAYIAAVCTVARLRGSTADRSLIGEHMKAARRRHGAPKRARPARGTLIADIFGQCDPESLRDIRDACIFALGFGLAARASELVGLDLERAGSTALGSTGVLQFERKAIVVRWQRSKTSQASEVELEIADDEMPEARLWLERWIRKASIASGSPLLRPLTKWETVVAARLSTAAISTAIRRRVVQAEMARGLDTTDARARAASYSSHSLKRGFCTTAAESGMSLNGIRQRSRHSDDAMVARYIGEVEERRQSGLSGLVTAATGVR